MYYSAYKTTFIWFNQWVHWYIWFSIFSLSIRSIFVSPIIVRFHRQFSTFIGIHIAKLIKLPSRRLFKLIDARRPVKWNWIRVKWMQENIKFQPTGELFHHSRRVCKMSFSVKLWWSLMKDHSHHSFGILSIICWLFFPLFSFSLSVDIIPNITDSIWYWMQIKWFTILSLSAFSWASGAHVHKNWISERVRS